MATIDQFQDIVKKSTMDKIDGLSIDLYTAGVVCEVYKQIKPENQKKLMSLPVEKIIDMCYRMLAEAK